jgi:transforming growth factor-beta-induced protein
MRGRMGLIAGVVVLGLTAAACGSDATDVKPAAPAASEAPVASAAAPATELKDIVDTAVAAGSFNTLASLLTDAGLIETLKGEGPFTVFAPTDEAFSKVPAEVLDMLAADKELLKTVLTYHVVGGAAVMAADVKTGPVASVQGEELSLMAEGGKVMVNDANVITADVKASNGVIHVIDAVLLPPTVAAKLASAEPATTEAAAEADIVDTAVAAGSFNTLAAALGAAGLVETLKGDGPFTVFAPTDDAFAALPAGLVDKLLLPENEAVLAQILKYHVVSGKVLAADVKTGKVPSVEGSDIDVKVDGGKVTVNGANVTATDIVTSNGVIHVIDAVILPPGLDVSAL